MRFLRMLTNSLLAGTLGAAYLTVLVLQLNPHIPLLSSSTGRWFITFGLFYGLHLAVIFYVLTVARDFFTLDDLSPGWASVRVLAWLSAAAAAVAALLMWLNVDGLASALDDVTARRMRAGAAATTASAVVLLAIAIAHYSFGRRGSRVGAALFVLAVVGSLALPLAARGPAVAALEAAPASIQTHIADGRGRAGTPHAQPGPRVRMVLLDGASLEYVWMRVSEGRLPNFARMLESGAWMDLATIRPTQPDPVWAAAATGLYPVKNGVRSAATYVARRDHRAVDLLPDHCFAYFLVHLGVVEDQPRTSASWRARPLWSILSDAGIPVGIVRWPLTYPAPQVQGFIVSDRFHELFGSMSEFGAGGTYPQGLLAGARPALVDEDPDGLDTIPSAGSTPERSAAQRDRLYSRIMGALRGTNPARFTAVRYQSLDTVGHRYLQYARPGDSADVPDAQRRQFTQVLDRAYSGIDAEIGKAIAESAPGDLVLVVSGFGMQRLNPLKQVAGRLLGDPDIKSSHERAPDGFLLALGTSVAQGRRPRGSIVDVAPTVLYFLGLPVGRDMDGYARTDLFTRAFTAPRPIAFIPSYSK